MHRVMRDVKVVRQKTDQSDYDQQHVALHEPILNHSHWVAEKPDKTGAKTDGAVDDPGAPPYRNFRDETRKPAGAVDARTVDHRAVESTEREAEILRTVHEKRIVNFIHVIFVEYQLVETIQALRDFAGEVGALDVEVPREADARKGDRNRCDHQDDFFGGGNGSCFLQFLFNSLPFCLRLHWPLVPKKGDSAIFPGVGLDTDDWREELFESAADSDPAANDGQDCEDHERDKHGIGRFVDVVLHVVVHSRLAVEGEEEQAEHVKGGHAGGDQANKPQEMTAAEGVPEDFVLAEKAGEGRDTGDGESGGEHREVGFADFGGERAHFLHVLLAGERVDHAAGREEQQAFEEGVGHEVEDSGRECSDPKPEEHVAEL